MYKLLINEGEELEDAKELTTDVSAPVETEPETEGGYSEVVDEGEIEDALEIIGLNDDIDLSETQKRQLAEEAVTSKIYDKVKAGKLQPEDAIDILKNMIEEENEEEEQPRGKRGAGGMSDRDPYQKRSTIDPNEFPDIKRGYNQFQGEKSFMSGGEE